MSTVLCRFGGMFLDFDGHENGLSNFDLRVLFVILWRMVRLMDLIICSFERTWLITWDIWSKITQSRISFASGVKVQIRPFFDPCKVASRVLITTPSKDLGNFRNVFQTIVRNTSQHRYQPKNWFSCRLQDFDGHENRMHTHFWSANSGSSDATDIQKWDNQKQT